MKHVMEACTAELLAIAIQSGRLAPPAAENRALSAQLRERPSGDDDMPFELARQCAAGYRHGPLRWNERAGSFIDGPLLRVGGGGFRRPASQARPATAGIFTNRAFAFAPFVGS